MQIWQEYCCCYWLWGGQQAEQPDEQGPGRTKRLTWGDGEGQPDEPHQYDRYDDPLLFICQKEDLE